MSWDSPDDSSRTGAARRCWDERCHRVGVARIRQPDGSPCPAEASGQVLRRLQRHRHGAYGRRADASVVFLSEDLPMCREQTEAAVPHGELQMTSPIDDVLEEIRPHLPMRVKLLGEKRLRRIVGIAIKEWPTEQMYASGDDTHKDDVRKALEEQVKSSYLESEPDDQRYGFAILAIVLTAAISAIIQQMIAWWWNKPKNRDLMTLWQRQI